MAFDVPKAIEKLAEAVKNGFRYAEEAKEHQSETEILKELKKMQKGLNIAEKIIILAYKYYLKFSEKDKRKFNNLLEDFIKYN